MSITGTPASRAAYSVGGCRMIALAVGTSHLLSEEGFLTTHSGPFSPTSGDSRIATTEIPACLSCVQYRAIPAPTSASAGGPPAGWAAVFIPGRSLVITTSGRTVVSRSCSTVTPQAWQESYDWWVRWSSITVAVHAQVACSSVTSFQCRRTAIACSAETQLPATESPTRATVSTGWLVSPNTHSLGSGTCSPSRQPCRQYDGRLSSLGGGSTGSAGTDVTLPASTAAPGYLGPSFPCQGAGWPAMNTHTRATGKAAASAVDTDSEGCLASGRASRALSSTQTLVSQDRTTAATARAGPAYGPILWPR